MYENPGNSANKPCVTGILCISDIPLQDERSPVLKNGCILGLTQEMWLFDAKSIAIFSEIPNTVYSERRPFVLL